MTHKNTADTSLSDKLVQTALEHIGDKSVLYISAEKGLSAIEGFDCSGFVASVLTEVGITVPAGIRHCVEFFDLFGIPIHPGCHKAGDLIFFSRDGLRPTHMGIMLDSKRYIHAPGVDGTTVCISELPRLRIPIKVDRDKRANTFYRYNPIGFKRPAIQKGRYKYPI